MTLNDWIQWICVAIVLVIVAVAAVRHIIGMVRWSRRMKDTPSDALPPCCGPEKKKKASAGKPEKGSFCAGCGADCPLSELKSGKE